MDQEGKNVMKLEKVCHFAFIAIIIFVFLNPSARAVTVKNMELLTELEASDFFEHAQFYVSETNQSNTKSITSFAVSDDGLLWIAKNSSGSDSHIDVYDWQGNYQFSLFYQAHGVANVIQEDGKCYLYFIRENIMVELNGMQLPINAYIVRDTERKNVFQNMESDVRIVQEHTFIRRSGNNLLKLLGVHAQIVDCSTLEEVILYDATGECVRSIFTNIFFFLFLFASIVFMYFVSRKNR